MRREDPQRRRSPFLREGIGRSAYDAGAPAERSLPARDVMRMEADLGERRVPARELMQDGARPDQRPRARELMEDPARQHDVPLAGREIMMGARAMAGRPRGRAIEDQRAWERHMAPRLMAEHPPEHAPVAGAHARLMERGRPGLVPRRERERYNAWAAQRAAATDRAERRQALRARDLMEDRPFRPEIVDMGGGREAMMTSPRSAVPWKPEREQAPFRPEVVDAGEGVRALMVQPDRAVHLPEDPPETPPWRPELVDAGEGARALMTSPRSAVPWRDEDSTPEPGGIPETHFDDVTGMGFYRPAPGAPWRHAQRDPYMDRPMSAMERQRLVSDRAEYTMELNRLREQLENARGRRARRKIQEDIDEISRDLLGVEAALGGRTPMERRAPADRGAESEDAGAAPDPQAGGAPRGYVMMEGPDGTRALVREGAALRYERQGARRIEGADTAEHREEVEQLIEELRGGARRGA